MKKIFLTLILLILIVGCGSQNQLPQYEPSIVISATMKPTITVTPENQPSTLFAPKPTPTEFNQIILNSEKIYPLSYEVTDTFLEFPQGHIYFWGNPGQYGVIDLNGNQLGLIFWDSNNTPELHLPGVDIAFSRYSGQVAYLAKDENLELWIADTNISRFEKVWEDSTLWLGNVWAFDDIDIYWGPFDQYIILKSNLATPNFVVYKLDTKLHQKWTGECNQIGSFPQSQEVSVWCEITLDGQKSFAFLGRDELIQGVLSPPAPLLLSVTDWAFSPNGDRILFSDEQHNVGILNNDGTTTTLPVIYSPAEPIDIRTGLKWSQDSTKIMVYGYDQEKILCPKLISDLVVSDLVERPCWFVINSSTGDVVWWPNEAVSESIGEVWENLLITQDAVLSPDGEWLAMSMNIKGIAENYFLIIAINSNQTVLINQDIWNASILLWEQ